MSIRRFTLWLGVLAMLASLLSPFGCVNKSEVIGSGKITSQEYDLSQLSLSRFTMVVVEDDIDVSIRQSDNYSLTLIADDNMLKHFVVSTKGYTLTLGIQSLIYRNVTKKAVISMPVLFGLSLYSGSAGTISDFNSLDNFNLTLADASQFSGNMTMSDCQFDLASGSSAQLSGSGGDLRISASDSSRVDMADFLVNDARIYLNNECQATITVREDLSGELLHNSHLVYYGSPTLVAVERFEESTIESK